MSKKYFLKNLTTNEIDNSKIFKSKKEFFEWRENLFYELNKIEWTAGFVFKYRGNENNYTIVDKYGNEPKRI